ncbi:24129_t:CDS:2 [Gigaspora rosea]|nr:24129_t:CDS:2 [Gigaspora rosea]
MADNINKLACLTLPRGPEDPDPIISIAVDYINGQEWNAVDNDHNYLYPILSPPFRNHTLV